MGCNRCGSTMHETGVCRANFRKAWPGRPAVKATLRAANGTTVDFELDIEVASYDAILALLTAQTSRKP